MEPPPLHSENSGRSESGRWRESFAAAVRFWEPYRLVYNLVLSAVAMVWVVATWPQFRAAMTLSSLLPLAVLALLANVCYCAAYLLDIPLQRSPLATFWGGRRWMLWTLGTILAVVLENYWIADEISADFR